MTAPGPPRTTVTADAVQGLVVGDGNVVHQHFLGGITGLPTDYAQRVANFLVEYLGTPDRPVPFGGRRREAELLDAWLADPGAPPCLLLCAGAGQGKSALLARWSRALLARGEAVAFVPASIRYRTNLAGVFFPALAARLAGFHGDETPSDSHAPAEVWRGMVADYLARPLPDGRRLLVVLDGLDEAADWEAGADLLPAAPPPGLRVVVSARTTAAVPTGADWLRTLGLDGPGRAVSLPLSGLTEDDVLHLVGADAPALARELHRLSGGDPLLLSLHLRDGRPDDLTALAATPPGLAGYFDRWWAEQRQLWRAQYGAFDALEVERRVGALLALFSRAAGPLDRDDLTALDPELPPHAITAALAPLTRFLLGDGRSYALAHSRLGEYWAERHVGAAESRRLDRRFAAYGLEVARDLREGSLTPAEASPYVVQYLSTHLDRVAAGPEDRLPLVHERWRQAWQYVEGTDSGFLADVRACRRALGEANGRAVAEGRNVPFLAAEVRCVLTENSVVDQSRNLSPALLSALVERGMWSAVQALVHARRIPDPDPRARALLAVAERLPEGRQRREVCGEAIAAAGGEIAGGRDALQGEVLPHAARLGAAREAWEVARNRCGPVLPTILTGLAPYADDGLRADVRRWVEENVDDLADFEDTLDVAGPHHHRWPLLAGCAPFLSEDRRRALERRLSDAEWFPFGFRPRVPSAETSAPPSAEKRKAAVEQASKSFADAIAYDTAATDEGARPADHADALIALGPWLPDRQHAPLADAVVALRHPWPRTNALAGVLAHVRGEPRARLLAAVELLPLHLMRCKAYLAAADSEDRPDHRARHAVRALQEAHASGSEAYWLDALERTGDALPDSALPGLVEIAAASEYAVGALRSLIGVHMRRGRTRDALAVAARVPEAEERPWLLLPHCDRLSGNELRDLAREVERFAACAELWWLVSRVRQVTADLPPDIVDPACAALLARGGSALGNKASALLLARRSPGTPLPFELLTVLRDLGDASSDEEQRQGALVGLVRAGHTAMALTMVGNHMRGTKTHLRFVEAVVTHGSDADVEAVLAEELPPAEARLEALAALIPRAPAEALPGLGAAVGQNRSDRFASPAACALARRLLEEEQPERALACLRDTEFITGVTATAEAVADVLPHVPREAVAASLDWLEILSRHTYEEQAAQRLATALPPGLAEELLARLRDGSDGRQGWRPVPATVVAALPAPRRQRAALESWADLEADPRPADGLFLAAPPLVRWLPAERQDAATAWLLRRARETGSGFFSDAGRVEHLLPFLHDDDLDEAVRHIVHSSSTQERTVAALDARLAESGRAGQLKDRLPELDPRLRTIFLVGLSQRAGPEEAQAMLRDALRTAQRIGDQETALTVMADTARQAIGERRPALLERCLLACRRSPAAWESPAVLDALVPQLGPEDRRDLLVRAAGHWEAGHAPDGRLLETVFRLMAEHGHARLALERLALSPLGPGWSTAFCGAVSALPAALLPEAHALAGRQRSDDGVLAFVDVLLALAVRLPAPERAPLVDELLDVLPLLQPEEIVAAALAELPEVTREQRAAIVRRVTADAHLWRHVGALVHFDPGELLDLVPGVLRLYYGTAELALRAVAQRLHVLGETGQAIDLLRAQLADAAFCRSVVVLSPMTTGPQLTRLVRAVLDCPPHPDRDRAIRCLAPHADAVDWKRLRDELPSLVGENRAFLLAEAARRSAAGDEASRWMKACLDQAEADLVPDEPFIRHACVPLLDRLKDMLPPDLVVDKALPLLTHPARDDAPQHRNMFRTLVTPLPPSLQYTALRQLLTACEAKSRAETLAWISDLLPVLTRLGGPDTPERLFDVVEEIAAAWP
ncbi:hypothetical protein [Streptomyces sp. NPDC002328]|uniref:hypothetical protein n=1 Tax=Streptomyces sp. NPDC002328 TaxID=3364642 RepID=UPI00369D67C9